jgi:cytochrome c oxidase subunit 4
LEQGTGTEPGDAAAGEHGDHHPEPYVYVAVAAFLAIVTAVEVWTSYTHFANGLKTFLLLVGMAIKFAFVALFFMHLRFDSRIFRRFFQAGIILAGSVYFIALLTLHVLVGK